MIILDIWKLKKNDEGMLAKCSRGKITPKKGLKEFLSYRVHAGVDGTILVFIDIYFYFLLYCCSHLFTF